jgi:hypothetical protein
MLTFSVIVNTYNRATNLRETVLGMRLQQRSDFEIVVVNDPSDDDTEVVVTPVTGYRFAVEVDQVSKIYRTYSSPTHRMLELIRRVTQLRK